MLRDWFRRRKQREHDLDRELRDHVDLEAEALESEARIGDPAEARYAARRTLGNTAVIKEEVREMWGWTSLDRLWQDLRYSARSMRRQPAFYISAILILALGIGVNAAVFSVVRTVILRQLPYPDPDQLVMIWKESPVGVAARSGVATGDFVELQQSIQSVSAVATYSGGGYDVSGVPEPYRVNGAAISASFFPMLGVEPMLGRNFAPDDDDAATAPVVILSHQLWQERFGADPAVIGSKLALNGTIHTVIGVMGEDFTFPQIYGAGPSFALWVSLRFDERDRRNRGPSNMNLFARLNPGTRLETAQAEMDTIAKQFAADQPDFYDGKTFAVVPLHEQVTAASRTLLMVLWGAVFCILLIASANLANMLLTRATAREREMAVRASMGASRWRLVRQLLTESVMLAFCGGALGLGLAWSLIRIVPALEFTGLPRLREVGMDPAVLAFAVGLSLITGLLFGTLPAWRTTRAHPQAQLQEAGRSMSGRRTSVLRGLLVVAQISFALMLLTGAGLLLRSFLILQQADAGFQKRDVLTFELSLPRTKYASEQGPPYFEAMRQRIASLPQVEAVGVISFVPLSGTRFGWSYLIEQHPLRDGAPVPAAEWRLVTPDLFSSLGVPIIAGRDFEARDTLDGEPVGIVNQAFAERNWPGEDPVGKLFRRQGPFPWARVVGVVGDVRYGRIDQPAPPTMYQPLAQVNERTMTMVVRTRGEPLNLAAPVRAEVRAVDPEVLLLNLRTMEALVSRSFGRRRLVMLLLGSFAGLALFLATFGIYSVISYSVSRRTPEIGVRMALGARRGDILGLVLRQGVILSAGGIAIGLAGSLAMSNVMTSLLYGIEPSDMLTIAAVCSAVFAVAVLASWVPARRAMRIDPLTALRHE